MIKIYTYNLDGFLSSSRNESESYVLKDRETNLVPSENFYKPKFVNDVWVEGMSEEEKDTIAIPILTKKQSYEIPNLKLGAKRLSLGIDGSNTDLENEILFAKDKYLWAKGDIVVSDQVNNAYLIELQNINNERISNSLDTISVEDFKEKLIINEYEIRNDLLLSFNVYIKTANDKLTKLILEKDIVKATQVIKLMEDVDENVTKEEAETILSQILAI